MSLVDIAIALIILVSLIISIFRGFIREALSLVTWIVAMFVAYTYAPIGETYLAPYLDQQPLRIVAAFAVIFIVVLLLLSMLSYLIYRILALTGVKGVDRSLGAVFGLVRGIAVVALLILVSRYMDFTTQPWWHESLLVDYFNPVAELIRSALPEHLADTVKNRVL